MSTSEDKNQNCALPFSWGKKRGVGAKKGTQFYESFVYDGVEYSLYDCVYLFKKGDAEPYVGKLVKIWEQPVEKRRVKVLWFFRPNEILSYLGDGIPLENEIFLASGEGLGLFNVNPLEVIAGKCKVICTSKDKRNPQPTPEELKMADYIFYRTFNVVSFVISDKIEDTIAGVEAKYLFNSKEQMKVPALCGVKADGGVEHVKEEKNDEMSPSKASPNEKVIPKLETLPGSQKSEVDNIKASGDRPSKKMKLSDGAIEPSHVIEKTDALQKTNSFDQKASSTGPGKTLTKLKLGEKQAKDSDRSMVSPNPSVDLDRKAVSQLVEVTKRAENERSKWFADLPWDAEIESASDQDRLVMLDNLDPDYSQSEVEDLIHHAFKQNCSVRLIEQSIFMNPNHGQALVIFKSSDVAAQVVQKLNQEILMLSNGRPLVAKRGITRPPGKKSSALIGLLSIDKYTKLKKIKEDLRKAASASHYSQGNTIEYEMGMEWMFLENRSRRWWEELHEEHYKEMKALSSDLKTK